MSLWSETTRVEPNAQCSGVWTDDMLHHRHQCCHRHSRRETRGHHNKDAEMERWPVMSEGMEFW